MKTGGKVKHSLVMIGVLAGVFSTSTVLAGEPGANWPGLIFEVMSPPPRAKIFGVDSHGRALDFEPSFALCVEPGDTIRLLGDGVNYQGKRSYFEKTLIHWRMSYDGNPFYSWDQVDQEGPFQWGDMEGSVFLNIPNDLKKKGRVQAQVFSPIRFNLIFVNSAQDSTPCHSVPEVLVPSSSPPKTPESDQT
jgi:hypothetical protein